MASTTLWALSVVVDGRQYPITVHNVTDDELTAFEHAVAKDRMTKIPNNGTRVRSADIRHYTSTNQYGRWGS